MLVGAAWKGLMYARVWPTQLLGAVNVPAGCAPVKSTAKAYRRWPGGLSNFIASADHSNYGYIL